MSYTKLTVAESKSKLAFNVRDGSEKGRPWYINLELDGEPLYTVSNICDTCDMMLGRYTSITQPLTSEQVGQQLREGLRDIPQPLMDTVATILPGGEYFVKLIQVTPKLERYQEHPNEQRSKKYPRQYWWKQRLDIFDVVRQEERITPLVSEEQLDHYTIEQYKERLKKGETPTALAFSLFDVRCLSQKGWGVHLVHFLLDGHHKVMAASELGMPITILSFLWKEWEFSKPFRMPFNSNSMPDFFQEMVKQRYE